MSIEQEVEILRGIPSFAMMSITRQEITLIERLICPHSGLERRVLAALFTRTLAVR